jgi:hypothetical protein
VTTFNLSRIKQIIKLQFLPKLLKNHSERNIFINLNLVDILGCWALLSPGESDVDSFLGLPRLLSSDGLTLKHSFSQQGKISKQDMWTGPSGSG